MNINPNFMHEDQKFKLVYGSTNTIWENRNFGRQCRPQDYPRRTVAHQKRRKANGSLLPTPLWRIPFWK